MLDHYFLKMLTVIPKIAKMRCVMAGTNVKYGDMHPHYILVVSPVSINQYSKYNYDHCFPNYNLT